MLSFKIRVFLRLFEIFIFRKCAFLHSSVETNSEADFWIQVYLISEVCFYHYCSLAVNIRSQVSTFNKKRVYILLRRWKNLTHLQINYFIYIQKSLFSPCNKNQRSLHLGIYIPVRREILNHLQVSKLQYIRSSVLWQKRKRKELNLRRVERMEMGREHTIKWGHLGRSH